MTMKPILLFLACGLAVLLGSYDGCGARADQPHQTITPELALAVQNAIRWRNAAWGEDMAREVAGAVNETPDPVQTVAQMINESDMRERAMRVTMLPDGRVAYDIGLMGVRCVTIGSLAEEIGSSSAGANSGPTLQIQTPRDRCLNGPARGIYAHQLFDPATNIRTAMAVLKSHEGDLNRYNGCRETKRRKCWYSARVEALVAALGGVQVKVMGPRMRKLTGQIIAALARLARSKALAEGTIPR